MSLKGLIQRLLDSRTTPAEAAHSAMPGWKETNVAQDLSVGEWSEFGRWTCAFDGYADVQFKKAEDKETGTIQCASSNLRMTTGIANGHWNGFYIPCKKGGDVVLLGSNLQQVSVRFVASIGGGV